ncbi:hypothetical protein CR513_44470, partial [Mucuna pruriens]
MSIAMHLTPFLNMDDSNKKIDQTTYKSMIRSLLYLDASKPDVMFSILLTLDCSLRNMISKVRKRQGTKALSIAKVEYIAAAHNCYGSSINLKTITYFRKGIFDIKFISTEHHLANTFAKHFLEDKLIHNGDLIGMKFIK